MEVFFSLEGRIWPSFLAELLPARCLITGLVCWWSGWVRQWAMPLVGDSWVLSCRLIVHGDTSNSGWSLGRPLVLRAGSSKNGPRTGITTARNDLHFSAMGTQAHHGWFWPRTANRELCTKCAAAGFLEISGQAGGIPSLLQASQCSQNLVLPLPHLFVTSTSQRKGHLTQRGLCHCASDNPKRENVFVNNGSCAHREWYFLRSHLAVMLRGGW